MNCILIVEDDAEINNFINDYFIIKEYKTIQSFSGTEALLRLESDNDVECIILDLMLPGKSGEDIIKNVRKISDVPIIVISAKSEEEAKIEVLKLGADDFLLKPFNLEELYLKVQRHIKKYCDYRIEKNVKTEKKYKNITLNINTREVYVNGIPVYFTTKEFDILNLMVENPNKVFSKENLFKEVWKEDYCIDTQTVTVHVNNIRNKMKQINNHDANIETVCGIGFKLC